MARFVEVLGSLDYALHAIMQLTSSYMFTPIAVGVADLIFAHNRPLQVTAQLNTSVYVRLAAADVGGQKCIAVIERKKGANRIVAHQRK